MKRRTTISIYQITKDELDKQGLFGESYDDLIIKLINQYKKRSKKK